MKALRAVTLTAAVVCALSLLVLNFPTRATAFGYDVPTFVALSLPLVFLGVALYAGIASNPKVGLGAAGFALLLAAASRVPDLTASAVVFATSLLLFVETLTAAHRFRAFEDDARGAGETPSLTAGEASLQYLRFAWWPLLLTTLITLVAALAHLAPTGLDRLIRVAGLARIAESAELASAYGILLFGIAALVLAWGVLIAKNRVLRRFQ